MCDTCKWHWNWGVQGKKWRDLVEVTPKQVSICCSFGSKNGAGGWSSPVCLASPPVLCMNSEIWLCCLVSVGSSWSFMIAVSSELTSWLGRGLAGTCTSIWLWNQGAKHCCFSSFPSFPPCLIQWQGMSNSESTYSSQIPYWELTYVTTREGCDYSATYPLNLPLVCGVLESC